MLKVVTLLLLWLLTTCGAKALRAASVAITLRDTRESRYKMLSATVMQEYHMF